MSEIISNHNVNYLLIDEYQLMTVDHAMYILGKFIQKETPNCRYIIESIEILDLGNLIKILVRMLDNNIKLQYVLTKYDKSDYEVNHINLPGLDTW